MKKLLLSTLAILLCLSALTFIACNGDDSTTTGDSTTTNGDNVTTLPPPSPDCDHVEEIIKGKEPTTSNTGYTDGKKCALCGGILESQYVIPALKFVDGFEYRLNEGDDSYTVTDIGAITDTNIVIPSEYKGLPVTAIGNHAFEECNFIVSVEIPDSVTNIGMGAFLKCENLESVKLSKNISEINNYTFSFCKSLTSIIIPDGVTYIGNYVFRHCENLVSIEIPDSVTDVKEGAFLGCKNLISVDLSNNMTSIADYMFAKCEKLTSIEIPESVKTISEYAFFACKKLQSVVIPNGVEIVKIYAFRDCSSLKKVVISDSVKEMYAAFENCAVDIVVYCEASERPTGWRSSWSADVKEVIWGYDGE